MAQYKVEVSGINTGSLPLLSNDEKETLIRRIKQGDKEARTRYIQGNLRLVKYYQAFSKQQRKYG